MGLLGQILGGQQRVQFIVKDSTGENTVIQIDASIKEEHARKSTPTKLPIEDGNNVSDHMVLEPQDLKITGIITDTPITGAAAIISEVATTLTSSLVPAPGLVAAGAAYALFAAKTKIKSPSVAAYLQLLSLQSNAQPFDVLTTLNRYPSMWISNVSVPRDSETGKAIIFTVELVQLILVTPKSVNVQIFANPGLAANKADLGQQGLINSRFKEGVQLTDDGAKAIGIAVPKP